MEKFPFKTSHRPLREIPCPVLRNYWVCISREKTGSLENIRKDMIKIFASIFDKAQNVVYYLLAS